MNARDLLARTPARQLHLLGAAALLAAGAALWFGMLRAPLANLRALYAEQAKLAQASAGLAHLQSQAAALEASVRMLTRQFGGSSGAAGGADAQLRLIREIGALAASQGVVLTAIRPAPKEQALVFVQTGFDVEAHGSYAALLAWLDAIEGSASRLAIQRFALQATKSAGTVELRARIAVYGMEGVS
jgi:Tfp pilus assembly protein PilO